MHILFLSDNFPPEVNAPATRTYEHCREWVKEDGVEVTVITCAPNFPKGEVFPGYKNKLYTVENVDGIRVIRVWTFITANKGFLLRILDYISFAVAAFIVGLFQKADVIIATSPQFFCAVGGWVLSFVRRKPWIMEVRDLWPESIKAVGAMKDSFAIRMLEKLELFLYRQAKAVVVVTDSFKTNISERGIDPKKIHVIKNGVSADFTATEAEGKEVRKMLGLDHKFLIGYIGTHGMAHALDFILRSAKEIESDPDFKDLHFLLIGDGAEKQNLLKLHQELKLTNVTMLDPIPRAEVPKYLKALNAALVNLRKSKVFETVIPSKIFEAAAVGTPILLGVEGEARDLVLTSSIGLTFEPEDSESFWDAVSNLISKSFSLGGRSKASCAHFAGCGRRQLAGEMFSAIRDE